MYVSKHVSGFDDSQADSITRKLTAKKKIDMFPMMIRCHIYGKKNIEGPEGWENDDNAPWYDPKGKYGKEISGALANGYSKEEMKEYFDKILGFAQYSFNQSHACSYSAISVATAWLKYYYPVEYMAAVLTMEGNKDKFTAWTQLCQSMGITIEVPNINISKKDFTPSAKDNKILYGLSAVKSVGKTAINDLLDNAPYESLEDAVARIPKRSFNKRIATNLIKAGAFDSFDSNRNRLINLLYDLRKEKDDRLDENYEKSDTIKYEEETIGSHITYRTWWEELAEGYNTTITANIISVSEKTDRKGKLMAFVTLESEGVTFEAIVFASKYKHLMSIFDTRLCQTVQIYGKKSDKNSFIVDDGRPVMPA